MKSFYNSKLWISCASLLVLLIISKACYAQLVINEVHPRSHANSIIGDVNRDGVRVANDEKFIELVNSGATPLDITGWLITTGAAAPGTTRHIFPSGTIVPAGGSIVVFSAGTPSTAGVFGGAIIQTASTGTLNILDAGATVRLLNPSNAVQDAMAYSSTGGGTVIAGTSFIRSPDITGTFPAPPTFATPNHPDLVYTVPAPSTTRNYSPGYKSDGTPFITNVKFNSTSAIVNEGSTTYDLVIDIINPSVSSTTTFDVALTSGSDDDVADYTTVSKIVAAGETQAIVSLTITDDAVLEDNEVLTFSLQNVSGGNSAALVASSSFDLTIEDNDITKVSFVSVSATVSEDAGTYQIEVAIENPSPGFATTAEVALTSGAPSDLNNFATGTVTFPANSSTNQTVTVTITDDTEIEGNDVFTFSLQNPSGGVSAAVGLNNSFDLTVQDNDIPALIINEVLPFPAGTGSTLTVDANGDGVLGGFSDEMIELVNAGTSNLDISGWKVGDAAARFTFPATTLLQPGEAVIIFGGYSGTAPVRINGSRVFAGSDAGGLGLLNTGDQATVWNGNDVPVASYTFAGVESGKSFSRIPDVTGSFVIHPELSTQYISPGLKSDGTVFTTQLGFASASATIDESDGTHSLVIDFLHPTGAVDIEFDVVLISGDPADIGNYSTQHRVVSAGTNQLQIPISVIDDSNLEGNEQFVFEIQNLSGGVSPLITSNSQLTVTINDNDRTQIFFTVSQATVSEGSGNYIMQVSINAPDPVNAATAQIALVSGNEGDLENYQTATVNFPAGSSASQSVVVAITGDAEEEQSENFIFELQNVQGGNSAVTGANSSFTLTVADDDAQSPKLIINEIHSRLALGELGDTNGDGDRNTTNDEFIEFVNTTSSPLDISGWRIYTGSGTLQHIFATGTIVPAEGAVVVFGGSNPKDCLVGVSFRLPMMGWEILAFH